MCGRYTLYSGQARLAERFGFESGEVKLTPRYNLAPGQDGAVVTAGEPPRLHLMRWGLVPSWAKDPKMGNRLINARAETAADRPSFRSAFRHRRCLVLADGFYEWQKLPGGKLPMHFRRRDRAPFAMAGLWERWHQGSEDEILSYTIITCQANAAVEPVHQRMPVILKPGSEDAWLDPELKEPAQIAALLVPLAPGDLESFAVSPLVNKPVNDSPALVEPREEAARLFDQH